jgi:hypothetical protein
MICAAGYRGRRGNRQRAMETESNHSARPRSQQVTHLIFNLSPDRTILGRTEDQALHSPMILLGKMTDLTGRSLHRAAVLCASPSWKVRSSMASQRHNESNNEFPPNSLRSPITFSHIYKVTFGRLPIEGFRRIRGLPFIASGLFRHVL